MSSDNKKDRQLNHTQSASGTGKIRQRDGFIVNRHFRELAVNSRMISGQSLVVDGGAFVLMSASKNGFSPSIRRQCELYRPSIGEPPIYALFDESGW